MQEIKSFLSENSFFSYNLLILYKNIEFFINNMKNGCVIAQYLQRRGRLRCLERCKNIRTDNYNCMKFRKRENFYWQVISRFLNRFNYFSVSTGMSGVNMPGDSLSRVQGGSQKWLLRSFEE